METTTTITKKKTTFARGQVPLAEVLHVLASEAGLGVVAELEKAGLNFGEATHSSNLCILSMLSKKNVTTFRVHEEMLSTSRRFFS